MAGKRLRSPEVILMVVAGVAVAILGPYALYQLAPHVPKVSTRETPSERPGIDLDISELDTLPDSLRDYRPHPVFGHWGPDHPVFDRRAQWVGAVVVDCKTEIEGVAVSLLIGHTIPNSGGGPG